jgi:hypothetical protein
MAGPITKMLAVFHKGQIIKTIPESRLMKGFQSMPGTGCYAAGRNEHDAFRVDKYKTICICQDCDWEI